jgi:hypothetical protein
MNSNTENSDWCASIKDFNEFSPEIFFSNAAVTMPPIQWQADLLWLRIQLQWRENARGLCFSHIISRISALEKMQVHDMKAVNQLIQEGCLELKRIDSIPLHISRSYPRYPWNGLIKQYSPYVIENNSMEEDMFQCEPDANHIVSDAELLPYTKRLSESDVSQCKKQRLLNTDKESECEKILSYAPTSEATVSPYKRPRH